MPGVFEFRFMEFCGAMLEFCTASTRVGTIVEWMCYLFVIGSVKDKVSIF